MKTRTQIQIKGIVQGVGFRPFVFALAEKVRLLHSLFMDVSFELQGVEFEWNEEKYAVNLTKHGVKFETAAEVFFDPFYQTGNASVTEEKRDFIIGYNFSEKLLLVVFVERGKRTRIISARPATPAERKLYEES